MKYLKLFLFLITVVAGVSLAPAYGQNDPPPNDAGRDDRPDVHRPNLLAELGLKREQIQQIRRMNQERRPAMLEAQRRMREANRNLDMAIYGDTVSDVEFQTRLKEFQAAQAELARLRFESELSVRKVLTPEQLVKFRELQRRFAEMQNNNRQRRMQQNDQRVPPMQEGPFRRRVND
jgi:Spy/CpxP family protein refolding chaperone